MKKIVLSGSVSIQKEINDLIDKLKESYEILDWPKPLDKNEFMQKYPQVHKDFMYNLTKTDTLLVVNVDQKGICGYIGAQSFAELCFGLSQNVVYGKNIELFILKMPDKTVQCYDEISLWLELGWIKIWNE